MKQTRRDALKAVLLGAASTKAQSQPIFGPVQASARQSVAQAKLDHDMKGQRKVNWGKGFEGQRRADLGDGTYLNPIVAGDHPDPTVLKDGENYYMTFSSFYSYPGVVIWHSRDLVNWTPVGPAVTRPLGSIWAMDLVKHDGRFYVYIPANPGDKQSIFTVYADDIRGPWSDPVDLKVDGCIDPGHAVGEDGKRYLFFNGVRRIALTDDGLATAGELEQVYNPWHYPDDWVVEMFAPEGPKLFRRGEWFYLVAAVGGTSGPPTGHMVTVARSRSIHGPWQDCPHNPIVHTKSADEPWWSRGHATVVQGPNDQWWMIYHGYENGFRTLGRQTLLEPIEWTRDGWFHATGGTLSKPIVKPMAASRGTSGFPLSDDFSTNKFGVQWSFFNPGVDEAKRARYEAQALAISAKGTTLSDCSPLTFIVGDRSYQASITLEVGDGVQAGIALFYSERMFCGVGFSNQQMFTYNYGQEHSWMRQDLPAKTVRLKVINRANVVTFYYSRDGGAWVKHPWQMEVSGFHHNVLGDFLSLKFAVYCAGVGEVRLRDFIYMALQE
jgi:xylan 1,4-beta-xylosidase